MPEIVTTWVVVLALGAACNVVALVLLGLGLRAKSLERLVRLRNRSIACAVLTMLGNGSGALLGAVAVFGAVGGESVDPSQKARIMAEGISEAMNTIAACMLLLPIPIAVLIAMIVLEQRMRRAR